MLRRRNLGFTLIELLVVLGVISLLVALLLPQLAKARERARYIRWKGYSHGLRANPEISAYYNFEEQTGDETKRSSLDPVSFTWTDGPGAYTGIPEQLGVVYNRAAGDPFEQSKGRSTLRKARVTTVEPALRDLYMLPGAPGDYNTLAVTGNQLPQWTKKFGRWQGKGAMGFGSVTSAIPTGYDGSGKGMDSVLLSQDWDGVVGDSDRTMAFWARSFGSTQTGPGNSGAGAEAGTCSIADWGAYLPGLRFSLRTALVAGFAVPRVSISASGSNPTANPSPGDLRANIRDGKWHWVVITADRERTSSSGTVGIAPNDFVFYVDGRNFGNNSTDTTKIDSAVNVFTVGNDIQCNSGWYGVIDEVQIWRTALTADKQDGTATGSLVTAGTIWDNWQAGAPESRQ